MKTIRAIARLTLRDAVRSRGVHVMIFGLLLVVIGFPLLIKGDGTIAGHMLVVLQYTLGAVFLLLGAVTLWISCGAISKDIADRHLRLTVVKPVHAYQIWLGRWWGIVVLNALLLLLCGMMTGAVLAWTIHRGALDQDDRQQLSEQILVARQRLLPRRGSLEEETRQRFEALVRAQAIPPDLPRDEARQHLRKQLLAERTVLPPGRQLAWTFEIPPSRGPRPAAWLRFRLASAQRTAEPPRGTWRIGTPANPEAFVLEDQPYAGGQHLLPLPDELLHSRTPLHVRFENTGRDASATLIFRPDAAVEVLLRRGGFAMNLVRAHLILLCQLALLAALGLTIGALFSFPVATFVAASLIVAVLISHFFVFASAPERAAVHHHGEHPPEDVAPTLVEAFGAATIQRVRGATTPMVRGDTLRSLADGILIPWARVGTTALTLIGLYAAFLWLAGSAVLSRRELAPTP